MNIIMLLILAGALAGVARLILRPADGAMALTRAVVLGWGCRSKPAYPFARFTSCDDAGCSSVEKLMSSTPWYRTNDTPPRRTRSDVLETPAERLAREEEARAEQRRLDTTEQRSDLNSSDVRIRAWEKLHGLCLPSDPTHPILDVIAIDTGLALAEVQEVQRKHAAQRAARAVKQQP